MKTIKGKVISDKMTNTVVVEVTRFMAHPMYHKRMRKTRNFHAHNAIGAKTGQMVEIKETKPISKTKHWTVIQILKENATT